MTMQSLSSAIKHICKLQTEYTFVKMKSRKVVFININDSTLGSWQIKLDITKTLRVVQIIWNQNGKTKQLFAILLNCISIISVH